MKKDALEVLVLTLDHAGEQGIRGKTLLQKRLYFMGVFLERTFGHRPHFYGPYSPLVESNLGLLREYGLIEQKVVPLRVNAGEVIERHDLVITNEGKQFADEVRELNPELAKEVESAIAKIERAGDINPAMLAVAAKIHFIVNDSESVEGAVKFEDIQTTASQLGWEVDAESHASWNRTASRAAKFLQELGLVAEN